MGCGAARVSGVIRISDATLKEGVTALTGAPSSGGGTVLMPELVPDHLLLAIVIVTTSIISAVTALVALALPWRPARGPRRLAETEPAHEETVFLFDDRQLVDASPPARALLEAQGTGGTDLGTDWDRLRALLIPRFPQFDAEMAGLAQRGRVELWGEGPHPLQLKADSIGGLARLVLVDPSAEGSGIFIEALTFRAIEEELEELREISQESPILIWRMDAADRVTWANPAYLNRVRLEEDRRAAPAATAPEPAGTARPEPAPEGDATPPAGGSQPPAEGGQASATWPLPRLFPAFDPASALTLSRRMRLGPAETGTARRQGLPTWFDCHSRRSRDGGSITYAIPADAAVNAEATLRDFVQTLTKTFAHLPIGLAVFDAQRQLALFNPALVELTTLGASFLSGRPSFHAFLDRLRDRQMLPEPRDYRGWRQQMTDVERAAAAGQYEETWTLASGLTYRVIGRPHTDGAIVLMFEDISTETSITRQFRSELEQGEAIFEGLPEAIVVFSPAGQLLAANPAYRRLWHEGSQLDEVTAAGDLRLGSSSVTAAAALANWQEGCRPSLDWEAARQLLARSEPEGRWQTVMTMKDGRRLVCRGQAIAGGSTLFGFREEQQLGQLGAAETQAGYSLGLLQGLAETQAGNWPDFATAGPADTPEGGIDARPDGGINGRIAGQADAGGESGEPDLRLARR